jgi:hypothetical protein
MIKEKYKQLIPSELFLYTQFGGIKTITILRCAQAEKIIVMAFGYNYWSLQ